MSKLLTLCLICKDSNILLGMKKRGFGAGKWNGFGGKLKDGETIEEAAKREVLEEAGVEVKSLEKQGILEFEFENNPEILEVHVFGAADFSGEPKESDEMAPQWFVADALPFDKMWPDDRHWMPLFLSGKNFIGKFLFNKSNEIINFKLSEYAR